MSKESHHFNFDLAGGVWGGGCSVAALPLCAPLVTVSCYHHVSYAHTV